MEYSIYVNREDVSKVEEEELNNFIYAIISEIGIEIDEIWEEGKPLDVETKVKLRKLLATYDIDIIHDGDRGYKIYFEDTIVGEWFKPRVILKKDLKARRASQRVFYEIILCFSSPFEDGEDEINQEYEDE